VVIKNEFSQHTKKETMEDLKKKRRNKEKEKQGAE